MSENPPPKMDFSASQVFLGFLFGVFLAIVCNIVAIFFGSLVGIGSDWAFFVLVAVVSIAAGTIALRTIGKSSFAIGAVIGLSVVLLLDGACAFAFR